MKWLQRCVLSLLHLKLNMFFHYHLKLLFFVNFAKSVLVNHQFTLEVSYLYSGSVMLGPYFIWVFFSFHCSRGREGSSSSMTFSAFHQSCLLEYVHAHVSL